MRAVIFDMDGVLLDSEPIYDRVTASYLRCLGVTPDEPFFDTLRGLRAGAVWRAIANHHGLTQPVDELAEGCAVHLDAHFTSCPDLQPLSGVRALVAALAVARIHLAVASSSRRATVEIILDRLGLTQFFPVVVSGDDVSHGKPDPEPFLLAASLLRVSTVECVVIEDSPRGIQAALAAGMRSVGLDRTGNGGLEAADLVIADLALLAPKVLATL